MFRFAYVFETIAEKIVAHWFYHVSHKTFYHIVSLFCCSLLILYCQQITRHQIFHESNETREREKRASKSIADHLANGTQILCSYTHILNTITWYLIFYRSIVSPLRHFHYTNERTRIIFHHVCTSHKNKDKKKTKLTPKCINIPHTEHQ